MIERPCPSPIDETTLHRRNPNGRPSQDEPIDTIRGLISLRKATAEMRRIADSSPELAQELRHIAD